ncbi:hypothetical protein BT69DRAFT_1278852 [Atractiella rhizophila]|nr:hypothetical protein BT69DRAFT_1278852 [Atractiella rhizophila]
MGKLNILHHKSYHPYKRENVERVRRDEEAARLQEEISEGRRSLADSEARLSILREEKRSKEKGQRKQDEREAERRLERQLAGKPEPEKEEEGKARIVSFEKGGNDEGGLYDKDGHMNFWASSEATTSSLLGKGPNKEKERSAKEEWEEKHTMYLGRPGDSTKTPWYSSSDLLSSEERSKPDNTRLEEAYKDTQRKSAEDPMALMNAYLTRRSAIKEYQEHDESISRYSSRRMETPREFYEPVTPNIKRLADRKKHAFWEEKNQSNEEEKEVKLKVEPKKEKGPELMRVDRSKELDRVRMLKERAKRKREGSSIASTPRTEWGYETGMFDWTERKEARSARTGRRR